MVIADISAGNLQQSYLDASQNILLLQKFTKVVMMQQPLNLTGDTGLAFQMNEFQYQFQTQAIYCQNNLIPLYITSLASALNFHTLFESFVTIGEPLIKQASADGTGQASSIAVHLSEVADNTNQQTNTTTQSFSVFNNRLMQLQSKFDSVFDNAIKEFGDSTTAISKEIDKLQNAIKKNINDIVAGSDKVGSAVQELGIGVLTEISKVEIEFDNTKVAESVRDTISNNLKVPSVDFVVSGITATQKGVAETAQAIGDLNSNNQKLATAYQTLALTNSLVATAKVIQVQNRMFVSEMKETELKISNIATIWGQSPIMIPPGSGISLGFDEYAQRINASTPADTNQLLALLWKAAISWKSLGDQLNYIKQQLCSI